MNEHKIKKGGVGYLPRPANLREMVSIKWMILKMIWAKSFKVGCGYSLCKGDKHANKIVVVCHYSPRYNFFYCSANCHIAVTCNFCKRGIRL
ncbi:unnamed protein product [Dracunculus medinensis]|uniref:SCP domain-containing protein n=1 Tax=Dracunculus medinensis TaxID=318479 RepID=A0A0N4UAC4_DRAME|nr:unnamed protein product [Dracunculus medinensis]